MNGLSVLKILNTNLDELVKRINNTLVMVLSGGVRTGAGVIWNQNGLLVTNFHVLDKHNPYVLLNDGRQLEAQVLATDPDVDLALLGINTQDLTSIQHGQSLPRIGELVFAFGHPWGQRNMVTSGIVSALISAQTSKRRNLTLLRTDLSLAPGNSGGPLVTAVGDMVGINNMIVGGDQSVAIPVTTIQDFINEYQISLKDLAWKKAPRVTTV